MPRIKHIAGQASTRPSAVNVRVVKYLTPTEVDRLVKAARQHGRHRERDAALILVAFHHGLRVSELCGLRWEHFDLTTRMMTVYRAKGGTPGQHPIYGVELRALRRLEDTGSPWVFTTERGGPMTPAGVRDTLRRLGKLAGLGSVHPHMLRHAAGYKLINQGTDVRTVQAYLGHRNIASTVRYTAVDERRFRGLF